jgi:transposase
MTTPKRRVQRKPPAKRKVMRPAKAGRVTSAVAKAAVRKVAAKRKAPVKRKPLARKSRAKPGAKKGRPTKYKPEYCQVALEMGRKGDTWTAIAAEIGVVRETMYDWMDVQPAFSDALKRSRQMAQQWWEKTLKGQARGKYDGGSATAAIFAMKNQFPDDYRDRKEHKVDATQLVELNFLGFDGTPIDFGDDD